MSLQALSQQLASRGRDGDSMLVHMTPGEVQGLQALAMAHGGSLTINPDTGLPEAGFLKKILPTVAGAALSMIPGVGPLMAAGIVGGGMALATGSLEKGLMAGLGAYGGAGLAGGLSGVAAQQAAAQQTAAQAAQFGAEAGIGAYAPTVAPTGLEALSQGTKYAIQTPSALTAQLGGLSNTAMTAGAAAAPLIADALQPKTPQPLESPVQEGVIRPMRWTDRGWVAGDAYSPTAEDFEERWKASMPSSRGFAEGGMAGANRFAPAMGAFQQALGRAREQQRYPVPGMTGQSAQAFRYLMGQGAAPTQIRPTRTKVEEPSWIKKKREEEAAKAAAPAAGTMVPAIIPGLPDMPAGSFDSGNISGSAAGGLMALAKGGRSSKRPSGRYLRGPGDGTSDSIPASIEGKHPAKLADGEFVIDARTVSEIGNGSSEAGAKKLYAMMDRVHAARRTAKRGKPSQADQFLPA